MTFEEEMEELKKGLSKRRRASTEGNGNNFHVRKALKKCQTKQLIKQHKGKDNDNR